MQLLLSRACKYADTMLNLHEVGTVLHKCLMHDLSIEYFLKSWLVSVFS